MKGKEKRGRGTGGEQGNEANVVVLLALFGIGWYMSSWYYNCGMHKICVLYTTKSFKSENNMIEFKELLNWP